MTKHEALTLALEILKAAYVPADLDEQREKAITELEALAQRPWVGLTDDERAAIGREMAKTLPNRWIDFDYARAVEAKLKEKNNAA